MIHTASFLLVVVAAACTGGPETPTLCEVRTPLVEHTMWAPVAEDVDPFRPPSTAADAGPGDAGAPESGRCEAPTAMHFEDFGGEPSFTINTRSCHWGTVEQAALVSLKQGDPILVRLWHFSQTTFGEAQATVHVAIGDQPFWTKSVPLPSLTGGCCSTPFPPPATSRWARWCAGTSAATARTRGISWRSPVRAWSRVARRERGLTCGGRRAGRRARAGWASAESSGRAPAP